MIISCSTYEVVICRWCKKEIDPEICWCGIPPEDHAPYFDNHSFVPIGCDCLRAGKGE